MAFGSFHDSWERDRMLSASEAVLHTDAVYGSRETRNKLERFGIADRVQHKGYRKHSLSAVNKRRNAGITVARSGACVCRLQAVLQLRVDAPSELGEELWFRRGLAAIAHNKGGLGSCVSMT